MIVLIWSILSGLLNEFAVRRMQFHRMEAGQVSEVE